jgi:small subunit ribosomal protein S17
MKSKNKGQKAKSGKCEDKNCPFHGSLRSRGRIFTGSVVSGKMQKTVTVEWEWQHYLRKYERFERRRSRVKAHNPQCINAVEGDIVKIMECRPLSKSKNFVIIEVLGKEKGFKERMEALEESKVKREIAQEQKANETAKEGE